jgi:hypothetical protein
VFEIHAFIRHGDLDKQVPLVTVLMSGKTKQDYCAVFSSILDLLKPDIYYPKVKEIMLDFEAAAWQACKEIFPGVKAVGCLFHLNQSFYRNIKKIGLAPLYRRDKDIRKICREILSLYLLPHNKIEGRFNYIKENTTNDLVLRFCCYIENTYINSIIWPPSSR